MTPQRVVLVGFMASGKTEVGARLSKFLGWRHVDLDAEIERIAEASVQEIFARRGEAAFRALEVQATDEVVGERQVVLSPGGGWITNPGVLQKLPDGTLTVWLKVSPEEVVRRLENAPGQPVRPLLAGGDPAVRVKELLERREPLYRQATIVVDTDDRSIDEVVDIIMDAMRR